MNMMIEKCTMPTMTPRQVPINITKTWKRLRHQTPGKTKNMSPQKSTKS